LKNILVIRFGSLGDLCLLGWSMPAYAHDHQTRITLATKPAFAPLMRQVRGIDQVVELPGSGLAGLWQLARSLKQENWDTIIDAHGVLRSHGLAMMMGCRPDARINKDTRKRLAMLKGSDQSQLAKRNMRQRFDELFDQGGIEVSVPPLAHLAETTPAEKILALAPGAQWDTKRWPQENFAALLKAFRSEFQVPVHVFLGPREESWFAGSELEAACAELTAVEVIRRQSLPEVAQGLARCTALVTNDSGLLHIAEAGGTPVLAFFGPTVEQFGYFPCLPQSEVLQVSLDCRPCSRNGKRPCHLGDPDNLACLRGIKPEQAQPFLHRMFAS